MGKILVSYGTLKDLSEFLKEENEKLSGIVENIKNVTIQYQDMLISDAGELFQQYMVSQQNEEQSKIVSYNQNVADKLLISSNIYSDTDSEIGGLLNNG